MRKFTKASTTYIVRCVQMEHSEDAMNMYVKQRVSSQRVGASQKLWRATLTSTGTKLGEFCFMNLEVRTTLVNT